MPYQKHVFVPQHGSYSLQLEFLYFSHAMVPFSFHIACYMHLSRFLCDQILFHLFHLRNYEKNEKQFMNEKRL